MKGFRSLICILFFITSCTTFSYVKIETLAPAEMNIPVHLNKIVVVDRRSFDYTRILTKNYFFNGSIFRDISDNRLKILDSLISDNYFGSLMENIKSEPRYDLLKPDSSLTIRKNQDFNTKPLNWIEVGNITEPGSADGVLSYESCSYYDKYKEKKYSDGTIIVTIEIFIVSNWILYDNTNNRTISISGRDTSYVDIIGYDYNDLARNKPEIISVLKECGINAGLSLIQKLTPYWVESNRFYFTGPGQELRNAEVFVKEGNWDNATAIWRGLVDSESILISSRACFNIALACEVQGKPDLAWEWIKDLYIPMWNEDLVSYQDIIKKRLKEQKVLNRQFERQ